jgi:PAT family beta-lactamase induction signal transducer AmpG
MFSTASRTLYFQKSMFLQLLLGFSSGLPYLLVFSTLSFRLLDAGITKAAIGAFALVKLPYTFKILWAPLLDRYSVPWLAAKLGKRQAWAVLTQALLMLFLLGMAYTNPAHSTLLVAVIAIVISFVSASQDIILDGLRTDAFPAETQAAATAMFVAGYRVALLTAGAGALWLAASLPWEIVYCVMAALQGLGILAILFMRAPDMSVGITTPNAQKTSFFVWGNRTLIEPFRAFMSHERWAWLIVLVLTYKLGDACLRVMINPFYVEMGYTKMEIAEITKVFGFAATLLGAFMGGALVARWGLYRSLVFGAWGQMLSNLAFVWLAGRGHDIYALAGVVMTENVLDGISSTVFLAFFARLCKKEYTITHFAMLTSLMAFTRDVIASSSGVVAEQMSWAGFFIATALLVIPALIVLSMLRLSIQKLRNPAPQSLPLEREI